MFGHPKDVKGNCNARLYLGDDYGDGTTTIRCGLPPDHAGVHEERFVREGKPVLITWHVDESVVCSKCGEHVEDFYGERNACRDCCSEEIDIEMDEWWVAHLTEKADEATARVQVHLDMWKAEKPQP